ncbi:regulatory protein RecX [Viscerimonas tarda]
MVNEKQATARMASYCSKAERCEQDVRKKLLAWELNKEEIGRILAFLRSENYLNEERYVRGFVKDKMRFNKWGRNKIVFELKRKQIPESLIKSSFAELPVEGFEESLMKALQTKMKSVKAATDYEKRQKLFRFALGRGFQPDMIERCLGKLINNNFSDEYFC